MRTGNRESFGATCEEEGMYCSNKSKYLVFRANAGSSMKLLEVLLGNSLVTVIVCLNVIEKLVIYVVYICCSFCGRKDFH